MKKIILLIASLLTLSPFTATASITTVPWFYNTSTAQIYTYPNSGLNVGIGTTSPYAKLSVVGQVVGAFFTATTTSTSTLPRLTSTGFSLSGATGCAQFGAGGFLLGTGVNCGTGGGGGTGTVSTSSVPNVGDLAYWTSNGYPSLLGSVATGTLSGGGPITVTAGTKIIGANATIACPTCNTSSATVSSVATNNGLTGGTITTTGTIGLDLTAYPVNNLILTYNGTRLTATGTPSLTVGNLIATSTATSTFAGGVDASRVCITGTTKCLTSLTNGTVTSVATGNGLTGGTITTSGTISVNSTGLVTNNFVTWNGTNFVATGTPTATFGQIFSTSTASSTFAGGIDAARVCLKGTTTCLAPSGGGSSSSGPINVLQASNGSGGFIATGTPSLTAGYLIATSTTASSTLKNVSVNELKVANNTYGNRFRVPNESTGEGYYGTDTSGNIYNMLTINSNNDMHLIPNFTGNHTYIGFNNSSPLTFGDSCCGGNPPASITFNTVGNIEFASGSHFLIDFLTTSTSGNAVCILGTHELVTAGNTTCVTSSKRFKHDIAKLTVSGLDIVNGLKPVTFTRNVPTQGQPTGKEVGLIAEDVQEVAPLLVEYDPDGKTPRSVRYDSAVAYLVKAIQELDVKVGQAKGTVQDKWQWIVIGMLVLVVGYQQVQIRKIKS